MDLYDLFDLYLIIPQHKKSPCPIYLAVGLFMLGSEGGGLARVSILQKVVVQYLWRTIMVLSQMTKTYIQWPSEGERARAKQERVNSREVPQEIIFRDCIGFLDGSRPISQGRKSIDSICKQSAIGIEGLSMLVWAKRQQPHDSPAFKDSFLYKKPCQIFSTPRVTFLRIKSYDML